MTEALRIGVIGAGAIAQVAHLAVLSKLEGATLAGVCDADVAKAAALARRFGVPDVHDDIEDLLRYTRPDAVVVCTPNHLHEAHTLTALSAGVPVLCERPLALSSAGVRRIRAAIERTARPVLVGMNHRYRSDVGAVRSFLEGGELGPLQSIRGKWHIFRPLGAAIGWRERRPESGGGAMFDLGLPLLDLAMWLAACPKMTRVSAVFGRREEGAGVEDFALAFLQCQDAHNIVVDVSWRHVGPHETFLFEVAGTHGSASIGPLVVYKELHGAPVNVTPPVESSGHDPFSASYRGEWEHFLQIARGETTAPPLTDHERVHETMEAIERSAREGREITL